MKLLRRHLFLLLAGAALLPAIISYFTSEQNLVSSTEDHYLAAVQGKVTEEIRQSNADLSMVKNRLQQAYDTSFTNLKITTKHPFFIFINQRLIYWSEHRFVPTAAQIAGDYPIKTFDWDGSKYLVNRLPFMVQADSVVIYSLIELYQHYNIDRNNLYLQSGYNNTIFSINPQRISLEQSNEQHNVYSPNKEFLFSIETPKLDTLKDQNAPHGVVWWGTLSVLLLGAYAISWIIQWNRQHRFEWSFLLLATYLIFVRGLMLFFGVPFAFYENDLFNPAFFAATDLVPSLGDLLFNMLSVSLLLLFLTNTYFRTSVYLSLSSLKKQWVWVLAVVLIALSFWVFWQMINTLNSVYTNSQYRLDFKLSMDFWKHPIKIACLMVFVLASTTYFLAIHLLASLYSRLLKKQKWIIGIGICLIMSFLIGFLLWWASLSPWLLLTHSIYFVVLCIFKLPRFLYTYKYQTSLYFFVGALVTAITATVVIHQQELRKDWELKQEFGKNYLAENDEIGEFLINKAQEKIKADSLVQQLMQEPFLPRERVQQRIKQTHLEKYLDKYAVEIVAFDSLGISLDTSSDTSANYVHYEQKFKQDRYKTRYPDLYFVNDVGNKNIIKQYIGFVALQQANGAKGGFVILDLKLWDGIAQNSVFSDILSDSRLNQSPEASSYSYAIYDKSNLMLLNTGSYNYEKKMPVELFANPALYQEGISQHGFRHVGVRSSSNRHIVVSSAEVPIKSIFANFSFLFLILVVYIIFIMIGYAVVYGFSKMNVNFATKIQIYLNVAFLMPLLLVVGITLSIISNTLKSSQENAYLSLTKNICSNFQESLKQFTEGKMSAGYLADEVKKVAKESGRDISVFDITGRLITSNQETFYKRGLLSKYINPEAYMRTVEDKEREVLLPEQLGSLPYTTAYLSMKSYEGTLYGVVSVPFYDSKASFEKQVMDVIGSILNAFTSIFIVLLVLSFFASNILTGPLRLITQKIRKTNLDKLNERLEWKSDDEIGLLVGEYNNMLQKLEESKVALSNSEKQSAWREMAKQVAHEIKNPLTPMKLTLQQLQRTLPQDNPQTKRMVDRVLNSLIDQIDNISDIANSFSDFAKMPVPKTELFDIVAVTQSAVSLQTNHPKLNLKADIPARSIYVMGDKKLMSSAITNLILNGIQSVPDDREPEINIRLVASDDHVTIEVQDNGDGIPDSIRNKVFIPSFSTKKEGSGVGLALAKRGIEHAGGSIWFESTEYDGTTFFINLPLAES